MKRPEIDYARFPQIIYKAVATHPEGVDRNFIKRYNRAALRQWLSIPAEEVARREKSAHSVYDADAVYAIRNLEVVGLIYCDSHKNYHAVEKYIPAMKAGLFRNSDFWEEVRSYYKNDVRKGTNEVFSIEKWIEA